MAEADPELPITVNVHDAKTHFSKLLDRAHGGEEIILAKAGKPYAKLVPFDAAPATQRPRRQPGALKHLGPVPDSFHQSALDDADLDAWERKLDSF